MRRSTPRPAALAVLTIVSLAAALAVPATAAWDRAAPGSPTGFQGEDAAPTDVDRRAGRRVPTGAQLAAVDRLGAEVRWNDFGTPRSLIRYGDHLATGLPDDPVTAARTWLRQNRGLFRLSAAAIEGLEVLRVAPIGDGHAVLLRQRFGGIPAAAGGLVALGVDQGNVAYVSSSLAAGRSVLTATLGIEEGFARAARNVGLVIDAGDVSTLRKVSGWTRLRVQGLGRQQSAPLVAVPTPRDGVRPAYQTFL